MMLERISFALVNNRARYNFFVHEDGTIASTAKLNELHEARVGLMKDVDFPTEEQYEAIQLLACYAVGVNPTVTIVFEEATAPFMAKWPPGDPIHAFAEIIEGT
jgi:hypothetical protein